MNTVGNAAKVACLELLVKPVNVPVRLISLMSAMIPAWRRLRATKSIAVHVVKNAPWGQPVSWERANVLPIFRPYATMSA